MTEGKPQQINQGLPCTCRNYSRWGKRFQRAAPLNHNSVCVSYVGSSDVLSERRQQRSSGAALGTRLRVAAGLAAKMEAAGDGCFQLFRRLYPRRWWVFLHVTSRRDGSPGLRCTIEENRHATKFLNPPNPLVSVRTLITGAKSSLKSSARAVFCAQDTLCRLESVRRPGWPLNAASVSKVAGGAHAWGLDVR